MKKSLIFCLLLSLSLTTGCLLEDGKDEKGTGTIKVTVNTTTDIWGYPASTTVAYAGNADGKFHYPNVGGTGVITVYPGNGSNPNYYYPSTITSINNDATTATASKLPYNNLGTRKNYIYIFSTLSQKSDDNPVLYSGSSDINNAVIEIENIEPGTYYVVAFYDYRTGGNVENIFNRYDRYAIYTDTANAETGTVNSTPFFDKAATITVGEGKTVEITLDIYDKSWILGKPKATDASGVPSVDYDMGRYFIRTGDSAIVE